MTRILRMAPWATAGIEPSVAELLSDPIGNALLRADQVSASEVFAIVSRLQHSPNIGSAFQYRYSCADECDVLERIQSDRGKLR